jgi:hypothetical protein
MSQSRAICRLSTGLPEHEPIEMTMSRDEGTRSAESAAWPPSVTTPFGTGAEESTSHDPQVNADTTSVRVGTAAPHETPPIPAALFRVRDAIALHRIGRQREALRTLRETEAAITDAQTALWLCDLIAEVRARVTAAMREDE